MKYLVILLVLIGIATFVPYSFANCISLPCDDSNTKLGEPNYRFLDFSYAHIIGEPIQFILERTALGDCTSFNAEIRDEEGNSVWGVSQESICAPNNNPSLTTSQLKIGFNEKYPLIIEESGKYSIKVQIDGGSIEREFVVRQNHTGITLDRTIYPVPWEDRSPLQQFKDGIDPKVIHCNNDLVLVQKYDGSPACVTTETAWDLVDREWATAKSLEDKIKIQEIAGAEILEFSFDNKNKSIILQMDSFSDGHLIITIPRDVLDSQIRGQDDDFFILIDGKEIDFSEIKDISKRTFTMPFEKGSTKIEITVPTLI